MQLSKVSEDGMIWRITHKCHLIQRYSYPRGLPGVAINRLVSADALEFSRGSVQLEGDLPGVVGKNINLPDCWLGQTRQGMQAQRPCAGIALQQLQRIFGRPNNIRRQATHL